MVFQLLWQRVVVRSVLAVLDSLWHRAALLQLRATGLPEHFVLELRRAVHCPEHPPRVAADRGVYPADEHDEQQTS